MKLEAKQQHLEGILKTMGSCIVALSGGVDSAYLAVVSHRTLGENALAVTADSPSYPVYQKELVVNLVKRFGLRHEFIQSEELANPAYAENPVNRCYFCKQELYSRLRTIALERGFGYVIDGTNLDDGRDFRPGRQAGQELWVRSPLVEAGIGKADIRSLSKSLGLPSWDEPASACLSSRIPYGSKVTEEKLQMIERGEAVLRSLGFRQSRVRHHGDIARIEIEREELEKMWSLDMLDRVVAGFRGIGFRFVTLDLEGYRTGRLNAMSSKSEVTGP